MRRRHWAGVVVAAALAAGAVAVVRLVHRPRHREPRPSVGAEITFAGASATDVETAIAEPMERAARGVPHVAHVEVRSTVGRATLSLTLEPGASAEQAFGDLVSALAHASTSFPDAAGFPTVARSLAPDGPRFVVTSDTLGPTDLRALLDDHLAPALQTVPGVAGVTTCGGMVDTIHVDLDAVRLRALGLGVVQAARDLEMALGTSSVSTAADLATLVLEDGSHRVLLRDVAVVREGGEPAACQAFGKGGPLVVGRVSWQADALAPPAKRVTEALAKQGGALPAGAHVAPFDFPPAARVRAYVQLAVAPTEERLARIASQLVARIGKVPGVADVLVTHTQGASAGIDYEVEMTLADGKDTAERAASVRQDVVRALAEMPDLRVITATDDAPPAVVRVLGPDLDGLARTAASLEAVLSRQPGVRGVLVLDGREAPELSATVDRAAAARLGVLPADADTLVRIAMHGRDVGDVVSGARRRPVRVRTIAPR